MSAEVKISSTKEIKSVKIITKLNIYDYVLVIQNGELCKIAVSDLKKQLK